jgi:Flp pilus assembly protein TadD
LAALRRGLPEATAAGQVVAGDYHAAVVAYAQVVAARPDDPRLRLSYGEALIGDKQFAVACAEFEKLKGKRLGPSRSRVARGARLCAEGRLGHGCRVAQEYSKAIPAALRCSPIRRLPRCRIATTFRALFQAP